ncbi:MAG: ATP-binding cassette domain-containing protein, partial [Fimbriiglobus sp.]|nr:ATP-binding cassette domain-containing protein [Fimbriiglobus sp.]
YERETLTAITLTQVGFADHDQPAASLSGGWKKRLALARELVKKPDLLLMDEPTNHLDLPGVVWLEKLLRGSPFAYLVSTHDRAFLRAIADEILEISRIYPDGAFRASGGYDGFADRRDEFRWPTRCGAKRNGSVGRSRPSGGNPGRGSARRPTGGRNWPN